MGIKTKLKEPRHLVLLCVERLLETWQLHKLVFDALPNKKKKKNKPDSHIPLEKKLPPEDSSSDAQFQQLFGHAGVHAAKHHGLTIWWSHLGKMLRDDETETGASKILGDFERVPYRYDEQIFDETNVRGFQQFEIIDHAQYERDDSSNQLCSLVAHSDHCQSQS